MVSLLKKYGWHEWLVHTNYSFLKGASYPKNYVERAAQLGYLGLSICDYDGVYGIVQAFSAWQRLPEPQNLRLLYGAEIHLKQDHDKPLLYQDTIVLYARSLLGYQNLCHILSLCHRESKNQGFIDFEEFITCNLKDLIAICPMRGMIRSQEPLHHRYKALKEALPERLYIAISKHLHPAEDYWIKPSLSLSKQLEIPTLMCQDAFFHHAKEKDLSDLVQAIRMNQTMDEAVPYMFPNSERSFKSLVELEARYQNIPGFETSLKTSRDLLASFDFSLKELRYQYPREFIPEGFTAQSYLTHLVWTYAFEKYPQGVPAKTHDLLAKELKLIKHLEFADYFLTVWDIVRWARNQGILCQGRGSAANSAICFMLEITAVDPTKFDLLFERFISVERGDPPDIDVDFEHERREEVIQYIYRHYGRHRAAMVANVITFRTKGAIRFTGKALGISESYLSQASSLGRYQGPRKKRDQKGVDTLADKNDDVPWDLWHSLSERLKGFPRHMGLHSGGFVLTHEKVDLFVPREPATMEDRTIVQWNKDDLEELGFFKIDILALGMLTAIRKSIDLINHHYGQGMTITDIPQGDRPTYAMIQKADTVGTFQIESRAQMSMLPRFRPEKFYDLVVQVGIIRPGPIQGGLIHPFLKRRYGQEPIQYAHPKLIPILKRTNGVPIFQEQVMRIAIAIGDFSPGDADQLRKQLGSWALKKDIGSLVGKLEQGMRKHRIPEYFIEQILGQLKGFAEYGFPESHAVSFALIAYSSSWIKCHYPDAFFTALLNSQPMGFYSRHALIQAAGRARVPIRPICIKNSFWDATLEKTEGQGFFAIRLGFNMVKGLRQNGIEGLTQTPVSERTWQNLEDLLQDITFHRGDLTALAAAGAMESLGIERRAALWVAEAAPLATYIEEDLHHHFPEEMMLDKVERDFESFGTTLEMHPASLIKKEYWPYQVSLKEIQVSESLNTLPRNLIVKVFGMILVRQAPATAKGMVFVTLEDEKGYVNLAFSPQVYDRFHELVNGQGFICAEGQLQRDGNSQSIWVKKLILPSKKDAEVFELEREEAVDVVAEKLVRGRNYM